MILFLIEEKNIKLFNILYIRLSFYFYLLISAFYCIIVQTYMLFIPYRYQYILFFSKKEVLSMLQIDSNQLLELFRAFYNLTQLRVVLVDNNFNFIISYPNESTSVFCDLIHKNQDVYNKCLNCNLFAYKKCVHDKKTVFYQCHYGLTEVVIPIRDQGQIIGFAMFGQFMLNTHYREVRAQLHAAFRDDTYPGIADSIDSIIIKSKDALQDTALILQAIIEYTISQKFIKPGHSEFINILDNYIAKNISRTISVNDLCQDLQIKRTYLYILANTYLSCGIAEYIRNTRINYAKKLLVDTDMSIEEIASTTGFSDYTHFFKAFKKSCQLSAREYRKKHASIDYGIKEGQNNSR